MQRAKTANGGVHSAKHQWQMLIFVAVFNSHQLHPLSDLAGASELWYVARGNPIISQGWSEEKGYIPSVDDQQDFTLINGVEIDGYTILKFKRKLNTCDWKNDIEIKNETTFLIFAWNQNDPKDNIIFGPHSTKDRKMKSLHLLNYQTTQVHIQLPPDTFTVDLQAENVLLLLSLLHSFKINNLFIF